MRLLAANAAPQLHRVATAKVAAVVGFVVYHLHAGQWVTVFFCERGRVTGVH